MYDVVPDMVVEADLLQVFKMEVVKHLKGKKRISMRKEQKSELVSKDKKTENAGKLRTVNI